MVESVGRENRDSWAQTIIIVDFSRNGRTRTDDRAIDPLKVNDIFRAVRPLSRSGFSTTPTHRAGNREPVSDMQIYRIVDAPKIRT